MSAQSQHKNRPAGTMPDAGHEAGRSRWWKREVGMPLWWVIAMTVAAFYFALRVWFGV